MSSFATTAWGAVGTAGSRAQEGEAARKGLLYKAQVARNNKILAEQARVRAIQTGDQHAQISMARGSNAREKAFAHFATGNIDTEAGTSANNVIGDIQDISNLDAATIRNNAARKAYQHQLAALGFEHEAVTDEWLGEKVKKAGYTAASAALISGVGSVGEKWSYYKDKKGSGKNSGGSGSGDPTAGDEDLNEEEDSQMEDEMADLF